jgi:hypothetical protein
MGVEKPKAIEAGKHTLSGEDECQRADENKRKDSYPGRVLPTDGKRAPPDMLEFFSRCMLEELMPPTFSVGPHGPPVPRLFGFFTVFLSSVHASFTTTSPSLSHQPSPLPTSKFNMSDKQVKPNVMGMPVCAN